MKNRDHVDGMIFYNIGSSAASAAAILKDLGADGLPDQFRIRAKLFSADINASSKKSPRLLPGLFFCVQKYFFSLLT